MNPDLKHRELTEKIIGIFYDVYNELGHGFLESVYRDSMRIDPEFHRLVFSNEEKTIRVHPRESAVGNS